jgi:2-haloacid dehalogenase
MKPVIVFDLNETLLDMSALDPAFARIFPGADGSAMRKTWFSQVLELFLTVAITGEYRSFDKLTDDALQMIAPRQGGAVSAEDRQSLKHALGKIPAYSDVRPGLERLKEGGFTVARWPPAPRLPSWSGRKRCSARAGRSHSFNLRTCGRSPNRSWRHGAERDGIVVSVIKTPLVSVPLTEHDPVPEERAS